jgi:hypothetical protein
VPIDAEVYEYVTAAIGRVGCVDYIEVSTGSSPTMWCKSASRFNVSRCSIQLCQVSRYRCNGLSCLVVAFVNQVRSGFGEVAIAMDLRLPERLDEAVAEDPGLAGARFGLAGEPGGDPNPPRE